MKTITNIIYLAFALFAFACFALAPTARAVCQEGCLTNANTALGEDALLNNDDSYNTAIGFSALLNNIDGSYNTAIGFDALYSNIGTIEFEGYYNTAIGSMALYSNTFGNANTAIGFDALLSNTRGIGNTAVGLEALNYNTTGGGNTANGGDALYSNTTGSANTATGGVALLSNTTGFYNTAMGQSALQNNTTGSSNIALGAYSGYNLTTGDNNIALGASAGYNLTAGDNNIYIGNPGVAAESRTIRIGTNGTHRRTAIAGISGATVAAGVGVVIDTGGRLGTVVSSQRFKDAIKPMDKASEAIHALKPVTFRYKQELDPDGIPQFGLVAEQVEKVNPDLVARDADGKPYTVRYEAVNAMLLNEFLKEHRTVQEQEATIAQLKSAVAKQEAIAARQQKQIEALTAGLQKVSAQLELSKSAPQTALNEQ